MVSPAFPGMFFAFAAMALLIFVSVSPPVWDKVNFLRATANGSSYVWGVFGFCQEGGQCSYRSIGYNLVLPNTDVYLNKSALFRLTHALILHPIAGALALFAFISGLLGVLCASRFATILMAFFSFLGGATALFIFVVDMVIWNLTKNSINAAGYSASLGNANWLTIGAAVSLLLAFCTATCGACGRFATGRAAGEKY